MEEMGAVTLGPPEVVVEVTTDMVAMLPLLAEVVITGVLTSSVSMGSGEEARPMPCPSRGVRPEETRDAFTGSGTNPGGGFTSRLTVVR